MTFVAHYDGERKQDRCTPRYFFEELDLKFNFTLDGASEDHNALLVKHSTLDKPVSWEGERVFCNPPWNDIKTFIEFGPKADVAVFLVPARCNARWFHRALQLGAIPEYFQGRLNFSGGGSGNPVDCCLLVFNKLEVTNA